MLAALASVHVDLRAPMSRKMREIQLTLCEICKSIIEKAKEEAVEYHQSYPEDHSIHMSYLSQR